MAKKLLKNHIGSRSIDFREVVESLTNQTITYQDVDNMFGGLFGSYEETNEDCVSEECQLILEVVGKYIDALKLEVPVIPGLPFGSFLSTFLPANSIFGLGNDYFPFITFSGLPPEMSMIDKFANKESILVVTEKLDWEHQAPIHQLFANLSQAFGFSENEIVSLFDIPQIMATPSYSDYVKERGFNSPPLNLVADRNFWYTRNKFNEKDDWDLQIKCKYLWLDFINNGRYPNNNK